MTAPRTRLDTESIANRLRQANIAAAEALAALAAPSVRIAARREVNLPLGASRFGGDPDLPAGFVWPSRDGRSLTFLAQLDLSHLDAPGLPASGWLLFFFDVARQPWGFDPKDAGGARVVHVDAARGDLVRHAHPEVESAGGPFELCALDPSLTLDLPDRWDSVIRDAGIEIDEDRWEAYDAVAQTLSGVEEDAQYHHLLGHPQLVQDDMRSECQLVTHGIYCGGPRLESERERELLRNAAADWQLLLQLDTDEDGPGWMWGDCGRLYFWIRRADLAAFAFDRAWVVLQCG